MSKIKVSILGSGSKGNSTLIDTGNTKILIDCGFSARETTKRLHDLGVDPTEVNGIILTHEHRDHTMGLENFANKFEIPVFAHALTLTEYEKTITKTLDLNAITTQDFYFRELTIAPFEVSHDSVHCSGYSIYCEGDKVSLATDLGYIDEQILKNMEGSSSVVIESNHDPLMLRQSLKYPQSLKNRIAGRCGHLSNQDCANAVVRLAQSGTQNFALAHLSQETNTAMTAKDTTNSTLTAKGADLNAFNISVASQDYVIRLS